MVYYSLNNSLVETLIKDIVLKKNWISTSNDYLIFCTIIISKYN
jgi:hypothetical protein